MRQSKQGLTLIGVAILICATIGCSSSDEQLAQFAQQSVREQSIQNQHMANQSVAIVEESSKLAEAAKELVKQDAQARQALLAHHTQLSGQLNSQQSKLDQQRQELAEQLVREPVIAAAISSVGLLFACALPLALAGLLVWQTSQQTSDDAAVACLLVHEMTAEKPLFLPASVLPKITAKPMASQPSDDSDNGSEFPF
jgi:hypothetical protein